MQIVFMLGWLWRVVAEGDLNGGFGNKDSNLDFREFFCTRQLEFWLLRAMINELRLFVSWRVVNLWCNPLGRIPCLLLSVLFLWFLNGCICQKEVYLSLGLLVLHCSSAQLSSKIAHKEVLHPSGPQLCWRGLSSSSGPWPTLLLSSSGNCRSSGDGSVHLDGLRWTHRVPFYVAVVDCRIVCWFRSLPAVVGMQQCCSVSRVHSWRSWSGVDVREGKVAFQMCASGVQNIHIQHSPFWHVVIPMCQINKVREERT